ncbi:MAG: PH domain-containing protein [Lachnospira sp.]|nr:PH domain-containing protein [Lachnospira sp.]
MEQDKSMENGVHEIIDMRNHISSVLEQMWAVLLVLVFFFLNNEEMLKLAITFLREGNILKALAAMGIFFLILIAVVAFYLNRWYKTTITVKDNMVVIMRRTLNRYVNSIAVNTISNINLEQNLFEMLVGTYKLKLDTSSLSTAESTDVKIVLSKKNAYLVKNVIMEMMREQERLDKQQELSDAVDKGVITEEEAKQQLLQEKDYLEEEEETAYDIIYDMKEIIINCLLNTSLLLLVISISLLITTIWFIIHTFGSGASIAGAFAGIIVQIFLAGSFVSALVKGWLDDFHFRAKRDKDKIYVSTGLIKKRKYAVPIDKINAVCFQATLLSRLFHRSYVEVINIGGEDEDANGMKLLLMGTQEQLRQQLSVLLPEYPFPEQAKLKRQPVRVLVKSIIKSVLFILISMLLVYFVLDIVFKGQSAVEEQMPVYLIAMLVLIVFLCLLVTGSILSYITFGLSSTKHYLMLSQGMFAKKLITIPYKKMQYLTYRQNIFHRLLGVMRLQIWILASMVSRVQVTGSYFSGDFDEITNFFQKSYQAGESK